MKHFDVIIIGGGNAALCAALAAREGGASVLLLERAPRENRGGNSSFSGGAFRVAYDGIDQLRQLMPDLMPEEMARSDFGTYPEDQYYNELAAQSQYRADADLLETVTGESLPTLLWMTRQGVRFVPIFGRQAFKIGERFKFWGGLTVEVSGGGLGLTEALFHKAESMGVTCVYGARARGLERRAGGGWNIAVDGATENEPLSADAVILACGGFHANLQWRAQYLGPGWDLAKVRGSKFNTGDGIDMALSAGAAAHGHWSGCHAVFYDLNAAPFGDINVLNQQKNYFTLGVVVNADGKRFIDEGADFRNYTYSGMGAKVLQQPGAVAWQIFDQKTISLLPDEYRGRYTTRLEAGSLAELAQKLDGIDAPAFIETIDSFNRAVNPDIAFNPAIKDGKGTTGLDVPKSNWALPLDAPPFVAYAVTCGITCTFGGLKVDTSAQVLDHDDRPIAGLYAAGELVGGLYYGKYAGGSGLTSGAVLGRIAGGAAALRSPASHRSTNIDGRQQ
ncbi:MAG: FAD-dependent tricarballylate dehydrogenase TcuA [Pseudomonadota bacterium]